jgi:rubredoxin
MISEITTVATGIATAAKALKGILDTVQDVKTRQVIREIQDQLIDLQTQMLTVHAHYQTLAEAKREVEEKLVAYEKWDADAARYELKEIARGFFMYVLKPDQAQGNPIHWLCPNCFQDRKKSIMQKVTVDHLDYKCPRCQFTIIPTSPYSTRGGDDFPADYATEY